MDAVAGHVWSSGSDSRPADDHTRPGPQRTTLAPAAEPPPRRGASAIVAVVLLASAMLGAGCRSNHPPAAHTASTAAPPATTATFAATIPGGGRPSATQLANTARILQARMAAAGIHGSVSLHNTTLLVTVPTTQWRDQVAGLLTAPGRFELRPVLARADAADPHQPFAGVRCGVDRPAPAANQQAVVCLQPAGAASTADSDTKLLVKPAALTNTEIASATLPEPDPSGDPRAAWNVAIELTDRGAGILQRLTAAAACQPPGSARREIAMLLDGTALNSVAVDDSVPCRQGLVNATVLVSRLTEQQARTLQALLAGGPLPLRLQRQ
jgi:preprotein translocase subunit SecD